MKQVSQNYKTGQIRVEDVEEPALKSGGVLVRTHFSVISSGTEGMKVREGKLSYLGKARARPDQVKKVLNTVRQQGLVATYEKVMNKLDSLTPLGYSLAGEVVAVGPGAEEFQIGQRVACAGAGYANHAEINFVPRNLVVPIPENVSNKHAAFATVGAIALHGFRQAEVQLGESACVIGLGLLGQLLVQILRAAGVQVIGIDVIDGRCRLAEEFGAKAAMTPDDPSLDAVIARITAGRGVDCIFITAGGSSNGPTELAVRIARDRGRVLDIGKTKLDLPWNEYYMKELDVRFSRSYGPGRYDPNYEERGIDYPIGYVRWTERRNLESFLELVSEGKVQIDRLISAVRPFAEADHVYQELADSKTSVLSIVFEYGLAIEGAPTERTGLKQTRNALPANGKLRIGMIGAGNYASSMLLPHLRTNANVELSAVATTTGLSAQNAKRKFGFQFTTTNYKEILESPNIDAVIIATRHASHARLVAEALRSGKATYVEKPLAIRGDELQMVRSAIEESGNDRLMVGFNRRFSPLVNQLAQRFRRAPFPLVAHYRVHAGQLESASWYLDAAEGSRFVGEAGHFFDVLSYIIDARPVSVVATALRPQHATADDVENIVATVRYDNGSVGTLFYLTQGATRVPKEYLEVFGGGLTAQLNNFESLTMFEGDRQKKTNMRVDKGQKSELEAFVRGVISGGEIPISVESLFDTTLTTLGVTEALRTGAEIKLSSVLTEKNKLVDRNN
jgi:predicted dehydrogenase/threonine dehydrogenase-like Zn-dependent dehydrogenase